MEAYKAEFIDFMVESNVLKFGEFEKRQKVTFLYECRGLCYRFSAEKAG